MSPLFPVREAISATPVTSSYGLSSSTVGSEDEGGGTTASADFDEVDDIAQENQLRCSLSSAVIGGDQLLRKLQAVQQDSTCSYDEEEEYEFTANNDEEYTSNNEDVIGEETSVYFQRRSSVGDDDDYRSMDDETSYHLGSSLHSSNKQEEFTKQETRAVNRSKYLVYVALAVAAGLVGATTYLVLRNEQEQTFRAEFLAISNEFTTKAETNLRSMSGQLMDLSTAITSQALFDKFSWPFVTLPHFDRRAQVALQQAGAELLGFAPTVALAQKHEWEVYSIQNQGWITEDLAFRGWKAAFRNSSIPPYIHEYLLDGRREPSSPYRTNETQKINSGAAESAEPVGVSVDKVMDILIDEEGGHQRRRRSRRLGSAHNYNPADNDDEQLLMTQDQLQYYTNERKVDRFVPLWQIAPVPVLKRIINLDLASHPIIGRMMQHNTKSMSEPFDLDFLVHFSGQQHSKDRDEVSNSPRMVVIAPIYDDFGARNFHDAADNTQMTEYDTPLNDIRGEQQLTMVGFVFGVFALSRYFENTLTQAAGPIIAEVVATCGVGMTYRIHGGNADYLGKLSNHQHDPFYDGYRQSYNFSLADEQQEGETLPDGTIAAKDDTCQYFIHVYPTCKMHGKFLTNEPIVYTAIIMCAFLLTASVFLFYDYWVQRRQRKLLSTAKRTNDIVSSLFPQNVHRQLLADAEEQDNQDLYHNQQLLGNSSTHGNGGFVKPQAIHSWVGNVGISFSNRSHLQDFLQEDRNMANSNPKTRLELFRTTKPIADLFPEATIMFADIVGFTAWSSMREPSHVFMLLETIYHEFDMIAKRRRVFKVETVGDCYVAVAGLPDPRKDHATVMARFASDCLYKMTNLVRVLEVTLGPDTNELAMRFGLHSGPVTAGVLRGERARFQLFGDTVNTTSRIETTGKRDKIHVSQETAELLASAGKSHWLTLREDKVEAKGKGELTTFWLNIATGRTSTVGLGTSRDFTTENGGTDPAVLVPISSGDAAASNGHHHSSHSKKEDTPAPVEPQQQQAVLLNDKHARLIDWNTEVLCRLLREIEARRIVTADQEQHKLHTITEEDASSVELGGGGATSSNILPLELLTTQPENMVLDEVQEIIFLPKYDPAQQYQDASMIELSEEVVSQLRSYVMAIAGMYRSNPFHNFEHASHVTMSVVKLLSRIVAPTELNYTPESDMASTLHDHTYGITSDPLTQFSVILSAMIHDADHAGVSNAQLVAENASIAQLYRGKSVAEQNSVDLAWDLLMDDKFVLLRRSIYRTEDEFKRFRQLVVNTVMATDIMDKDLGALRKARWNKAFDQTIEEQRATSVNRKATIVIEHLIQASDVAHTMQHWHVYRKWNARLFEEQYLAYLAGRAPQNPAHGWYKGEMAFFDFYIIPLAKKLKDCGVFGVSSDEYLNYAQQNRKEWERRGQLVVETMMETIRMAHPPVHKQ